MTYPHNPLPEWLQFEDEELGIQPIPNSGSIFNSIPLYLFSSPNFQSGNIPLFIQGTGLAISAPLYVKGGGTLINNSIPLYISGMGNPVSSGIPLYLEAKGQLRRGLNLVLPGDRGIQLVGNIPLYINGFGQTSGNIGLFKSSTLYIKGTNAYTTPLNLFLKNTDTSNLDTRNLNLFINAVNPSQTNNITLFLNNTGAPSGLSLFIQGLGSGIFDPTINSDGWNPYARILNLFIKRQNFPATMTLFMQVATDNPTSGIPLYIQSANFINNNIPLSIPNVKSQPNTKSNDLTISGF